MQGLWRHLGPGALGGDPAHLGQRCPVLVGVILRDINPMGRSQKTFFFAMGLCGLCMVVMELASLAAGRGPLLEEGMLTSWGAITLTGCLMASILAVYLAKSFREKHRPAGDED